MTKPTFIKKLKELFIRFNTSPKLYLKSDFYLLLLLIGGLFENSDESLLGEDGKIEEKYLPTIPTENKEYFPDYAFWLKPGAKKGALVLIAPETTENFGYTKNYIDFLLEVGRATDVEVEDIIETETVEKEEYDEDTDDIIVYSVEEEINRTSILTGNAYLRTIIKRAKDLLSKGVLEADDTFLIKFGVLNGVHDRSRYNPLLTQKSEDENVEPDPFSITCTINGIDYSGLKQTVRKRMIDMPVRYSELDFYIPISDIILWNNEEEILIVVTGKKNELSTKFKSLSAVTIYTDVDSYYLPMQHHFYALQYFQSDDEWKVSKIEKKTVRVRYHKTEATLSSGVILRNTYREYREPGVIMSLGADKKVVIDDRKVSKYDLAKDGVGNMFKRFVLKSSVLHRQHGSYRHKAYLFIHTFCSKLENFYYSVIALDDGHFRHDYYMIIGVPSKLYIRRTARPCNAYEFIQRNLSAKHIRYNRKANASNYKNVRYAYFTKVPLFRYYSSGKIVFIGYYSPKIVY